ncbi:unnamed protein product [Caenorhabditis auriculariae]|uniref:Uncharacterized protein n=1 Tax=Caenorhabditis auriculariae TaxID=2777116 RepID=A0A8S1HXE9_9PELO|nr:unnamed protein product [Caenorhabditis auriculariae]
MLRFQEKEDALKQYPILRSTFFASALIVLNPTSSALLPRYPRHVFVKRMNAFEMFVFLFVVLAAIVAAVPVQGPLDYSPYVPTSEEELQRLIPSEELAEQPMMDKRAQTFVRFGKRAQTFVRFGKRAQTFVRFGRQIGFRAPRRFKPSARQFSSTRGLFELVVAMMVIPVSQHKLIKIRRVNRQKLIKIALVCSMLACCCNVLGSSTNHWLYTSEVIKYFLHPNRTRTLTDSGSHPVYFKNATMGPWLFCWLDPVTEFHCSAVHYLQDDDPSDVTTSIQQSVRRAFLFMITGMLLDGIGLIVSFICFCLPNPYAMLLFCSLLHINAGIANFACIIVYMSAVSKEVGNKIFPASEMDDPLFYIEYGFSFWLIKTSFLLTELAALFAIVVYMAKRDERTFNRYKIRSLLNFSRLSGDEPELTKTHHENARYSRRTGSHVAELKSSVPEMDDMLVEPKVLLTPTRGSFQSLTSTLLPDLLANNASSHSPPPARLPRPITTSSITSSTTATPARPPWRPRSPQRSSSHKRIQPLRRFAIPVNSPHFAPSDNSKQ